MPIDTALCILFSVAMSFYLRWRFCVRESGGDKRLYRYLMGHYLVFLLQIVTGILSYGVVRLVYMLFIKLYTF
jgi:hypothetical protein